MSKDGEFVASVPKKLYRGEKKQCVQVGQRLLDNNFWIKMRFKKNHLSYRISIFKFLF